MITTQELNEGGTGKLPGHLGIVITEGGQTVKAELAVEPHHMAPNGYLHAGTGLPATTVGPTKFR